MGELHPTPQWARQMEAGHKELQAEVDRLRAQVAERDRMLDFARERSEQTALQGAYLVAEVDRLRAQVAAVEAVWTMWRDDEDGSMPWKFVRDMDVVLPEVVNRD